MHRQTVEIFSLNNAIQYLNNNYVKVIPYKIIQVLLLFCCHLCCLHSKLMIFYWLQLLLMSSIVIQIIPPWFLIFLHFSILIFSLEVRHKVRKFVESSFWKKKSDWLRGLKKSEKWPKNEPFWQKKGYPFIYAFLLQYKCTNSLLTFGKKNVFGKNLVLEFRFKNLITNQKAGFFKLHYLTNKLRYIWIWIFECD